MSAEAAKFGTIPGKYNPGHYITLTHFDDVIEMEKAAKPGVVGFQRRYDWNELEISKGVYDLSGVRADLDEAEKLGLQFVLIIADKTFDGVNPMPGYLKSGTHYGTNKKGGITAYRWKSEVLTRFKLLLQAVGEEFDYHPAFEGVAIPESALSLTDSKLNNNGYSAWKYRTALIDTLETAAKAMPHSRVFWYMNFLPKGRQYMDDVALAVKQYGVVVNGPDLLPDDWELNEITYPVYKQLYGKVPLAISAQFASYSHQHKDKSKATKYWTMLQLHSFAKNDLKVTYVFWNNMKWKSPWDSYTVNDAFSMIKNNQSFNGTDWEGDWKDSDNDGLSDTAEKKLGTKVWNKDSDGDTLTDGEEVHDFFTDPLKKDTDGGGKQDNWELNQGRDPLKASDDYGSVPDADKDGLSDFLEEALGTNKFKADTDGEGLKDGEEVNVYKTNPLDKNTDRDGINDRIEIVYKGTDPLNPDTDGGGTIDGDEISDGTNPLRAWDDK